MAGEELEKYGAQAQEAFDIIFSPVPALVLKSALLLEIPDIIARQGSNASLSLHEIAARLPTQNPHLDYLSRILRYLSKKGIFIQSGVGGEARYALSDISKHFFVKEKNPFSLVPTAMLETSEVSMARWHHLHECVLQGCNAFEKAHGKSIYACGKDNPDFNNVLNDYMAAHTMTAIGQIVNHYQGFKDLKSLVDVGGGNGTALREILKVYPHIRGINFDLPHVVAAAPEIPGIEHVGGSMFESVPSGTDAIFIKKVLLDWDDTSCMKILENCHKALPENGKLILIEEAVPDLLEKSAWIDILYMARMTEIINRSEEDWSKMVQDSGFSILKIEWLPGMFAKMLIIEATKSISNGNKVG
ncbi:hypothetical protein KI387_019312 [Taxus chinensis]|uniref:O-methyltransferase n=1 Tax=Taxus chinensis TaxID=29808 RepID=A0AA38G9Y6_TAXCH|nr:hypothetical protein KI387_019312 [Taxus chinensis]